MMWSGLHEEEVLRLQTNDVKEGLGYILVKKEITKNEKRDLYVDITPPVQAVLDLLKGHLKFFFIYFLKNSEPRSLKVFSC